jgi:hypothetical protein
MAVQSAKQFTVYIEAYDLAMQIFKVSLQFPADERF